MRGQAKSVVVGPQQGCQGVGSQGVHSIFSCHTVSGPSWCRGQRCKRGQGGIIHQPAAATGAMKLLVPVPKMPAEERTLHCCPAEHATAAAGRVCTQAEAMERTQSADILVHQTRQLRWCVSQPKALAAAQIWLTILAIRGEIATVAGAVESEAKCRPDLSRIGLCSSIEGGRHELGD